MSPNAKKYPRQSDGGDFLIVEVASGIPAALGARVALTVLDRGIEIFSAVFARVLYGVAALTAICAATIVAGFRLRLFSSFVCDRHMLHSLSLLNYQYL